jgi:uncharacterized membrane protein
LKYLLKQRMGKKLLFILMLLAMSVVITGCYLFIASESAKPIGSVLMAVGVLAEMVIAFLFIKAISKKV